MAVSKANGVYPSASILLIQITLDLYRICANLVLQLNSHSGGVKSTFPSGKIILGVIKMATKRVSTILSPKLNDWLDVQSKNTGVSKSGLIAIAVDNYRKQETSFDEYIRYREREIQKDK